MMHFFGNNLILCGNEDSVVVIIPVSFEELQADVKISALTTSSFIQVSVQSECLISNLK